MSKALAVVCSILAELGHGSRVSTYDMEQLNQFHGQRQKAVSGGLAGDHFGGPNIGRDHFAALSFHPQSPSLASPTTSSPISPILSFHRRPSIEIPEVDREDEEKGLAQEKDESGDETTPERLEEKAEVPSTTTMSTTTIDPAVVSLKTRLTTTRDEIVRLDMRIRTSLVKSLRLESSYAEVQKEKERLAEVAQQLRDRMEESSEAFARASKDEGATKRDGNAIGSDVEDEEQKAPEMKASGVGGGTEVLNEKDEEEDSATLGIDGEKESSGGKHEDLLGSLEDVARRLEHKRYQTAFFETKIKRAMTRTFQLKSRRTSVKREFERLSRTAETLHVDVPRLPSNSDYALQEEEAKLLILALRGKLEATGSDMEDEGENVDEEGGQDDEAEQKEHIVSPFAEKFNDAVNALRSWHTVFSE